MVAILHNLNVNDRDKSTKPKKHVANDLPIVVVDDRGTNERN